MKDDQGGRATFRQRRQMGAATGRLGVSGLLLRGLIAGLAVVALLAVPHGASAAGGTAKTWYDWFWPLGNRVHVEALKEEYVPFEGAAAVPERPELLLEAGDAFLDTGKLNAGFEVPIIGAVWQPRLWAYLISRTAIQSFDNGTGPERETELAGRLDFFANLQLTGTEKILLGLRPLDENRPGRFTRYTFDGADEGFKEEFNLNIETLFFEGDVGSLIPNLDREGILPIDLGFTVGRQVFTFQEGILINDTIDAVGLVRNNIPMAGTSNLRISAMYGWNRLDRNDDARNARESVYGLFTAIDAHVSTYAIDLIYVDDASDNGDGFYFGLAAIQRLQKFGGISTAFRINGSVALNDEIAGNVVGNGALLSAEISAIPKGSNDIVYFNGFAGIDNFTQAGREPILGGPLGSLGILFASPNFSLYGAEISPFTNDVIGFATGYQAFYDGRRRNVIFELAGKYAYNDDTSFDSLGVGFQLQQAIGRHFLVTAESFYVLNEARDNGVGGRLELQIVF